MRMLRGTLVLLFTLSCSANTGGDRSTGDAPGPGGDTLAGDDRGTAGDTLGDGDAPPHDRYVFVSGRAGLQRYRLEAATGALTLVSTTPAGQNPSFLAIATTKHVVYVADEDGHEIRAFSMASDGGLTPLGEVRPSGGGSAHIGLDAGEKYVWVANYGEGTIRAFHLADNGAIDATPQSLDAGVKAHQIVEGPVRHVVYVPCLGIDKVVSFSFKDGVLAALDSADLDPGAGPRHIAFHPQRPFAYVLNELDSTLVRFTLDGQGALTMKQTALSTLPAGFSDDNSAAELQVAPSGRFIYTSNRGRNSIAIFAIADNGTLSYVKDELTHGSTPRHFSIDPSGAWLLVANQDSDNVSVFSVDTASGNLTYRSTTSVGDAPQFVALVPEP